MIRLSVVSNSPKSVVESLPSSPLSELSVESIGPILSDWITFRLLTSSFAETPTHHEESLDSSGNISGVMRKVLDTLASPTFVASATFSNSESEM